MEKGSDWKFLENSNFNGYTLLVPSVAVGNVGQLTCDLLISSMNMKKIAIVHNPALIPIIGYDPYNLRSSNLSTACEVYMSDSSKLCVLQLRSPLVYKYAKDFLQEIMETFKEKQIKDIIILTSTYAHEKKNILSSPFRYLATRESPYIEILKANMVQHEGDDNDLKLYGGGFAPLFYKLCKEKSLPCLILYKYCSEGDNIPDAYDMVNLLNTVKPVFSKEKDLLSQLIQPVSWTLLFGRPPPQDIY